MGKILDIISGTPLFNGLSEDQLREIEQISENQYFSKGETVFSEGDTGNGFYVVADGMVKIFKVSMEGKEQILHIFGPGEPFGEVPVFAGQSFPANAQAIARSHLLCFPRTAFVDLLSSNPSLSLNMLAVLSMRLRQFTVQVDNLSLKEVPARLAAYLIYLADEQGKEDFVTLNISKGQLAGLLGTIPETLSRIFAKMGSENLIEVKKKNIRLVNRSVLEELAEHGKHIR
ncbi:MAG: Crp/Fnr family transcriptional regulator [Thermodesulfobacteriota bacterium]|nr:Crp/Fnr family transcriptional regulator [Thermodesulfobacteriota bacterium]